MNITHFVVTERERGLIGGDFSQYRAQTTRKVHALTKKLGIATPRGRKYSPKPPITTAHISHNTQWVELLLASSERAWADAMSMKNRSLAGSTKKQILSRYRRAITHATNLVELLSDGPDLLEAQAYVAMLRGGLHFEKGGWTSCLSQYSIARLIYSTLEGGTYLLDTTVDPSIKYAAHQSKLPRTKTTRDIAVEYFPTSQSSTRTAIENLDAQAFQQSTTTEATPQQSTSVVWRSRRIQIDEATVSQALETSSTKEAALLAAFEDTDKQLKKYYEEVIDSKQEAVDAIKAAIDELLGQNLDQSDDRIQSLQIARTAVSYNVIEYRIGRNRILLGPDDGLGKDVKLRENVALIDSILTSLDSVKDLPGVVVDDDLVRDIDSTKAYFRALKCLAIGRSHALQGNTLNALALFSRANEVALQKFRVKPTAAPTKLDVTQKQTQSLQTEISGLTLQYRALADLKHSNPSTPPPASPLIETFHRKLYYSDVDLKNLVNYPPKLRPIPVKPLFFDLAWNYIHYPAEAGEKEKPVKKGWFGFGR